MPLDANEITLDGQAYRLARTEVVNRVLGVTARRWQERLVPKATKRVPRENVRPGQIPGEWVITYDDWSRGITGDHDPRPGTIYSCSNVDPTKPGALRTVGKGQALSFATDPGISALSLYATFLTYKNTLYLFYGTQVFTITNAGTAVDEDMSASTSASGITDAIVFNDELLAAMGHDASKYIAKCTSVGGAWTIDDDVQADFFALVQDRLWRAINTNEVSGIGPTDNPFTIANWGGLCTVGDDDVPITDLNGVGKQLVVSKEDGLYIGDASALFPNVLKNLELQRDPDNGRGTFVVGTLIFYPHSKGLIMYDVATGVAEEVGPALSMSSASVNDENVGFRPRALAADGQYIWAAFDAAVGVILGGSADAKMQKTVDIGVNYTDYTANVGDNNHSTAADLSSLDTAANGDWAIIGYTSAFWGVYLQVLAPNVNASVMTAEYWNGSAWTAFPTAARFTDDTQLSGKTLARSGRIYWEDDLTNWASSTINSIAAYWIRLSFSAALDSTTTISEARIITAEPGAIVMRGRRPQRWERDVPIIWEPVYRADVGGTNSSVARVDGMLVTGRNVGDFNGGGAIWLAGRARAISFWMDQDPVNAPLIGIAVTCYLAKDDAGMPEINKLWIDVTVKGRTINSTHVLTSTGYRVDEATSYTNVATNTNSSPTTSTFSSVTGRALQLGINFAAPTGDFPTEINEIEVRFRELPTLKEQFVALLEVADGQTNTDGGLIPDASVQLTNLLADIGAGALTLIDPTGRSQSVTVDNLEIVEAVQTGVDYPSLLIELTMNEV